MNKKLFFSIVPAILAAAVPAFADYNLLNETKHNHAISVEAFYALGLKEVVDSDYGFSDDKLNVSGVSLCYTKLLEAFAGGSVIPEFFTILSFGYGSIDDSDSDYYNDGYYDVYCQYKDTVDLFTMQFAVGANLRFVVSDSISLFAGARIGIAYERVDFTSEQVDTYSHSGYDDDYDYYVGAVSKSDVGFLYGAGIGAEVALTENFSLFLSVNYIGSTAQPKIYDYKFEKQSYQQFSLGVRSWF